MNIEDTKKAAALIERLDALKSIETVYAEMKNKKPEKYNPNPEKPVVRMGIVCVKMGDYLSPGITLDESLYEKVLHFVRTISETELLQLGVTK